MSYALSTERDLQQRTQSVQGGVNANLHYTMMGFTTQQSGGGIQQLLTERQREYGADRPPSAVLI
ncbi:hypothetical protein JNO12_05320 [Erwinia aphidicola]|nr:hypothetical protein [Erwinia aphidicola]